MQFLVCIVATRFWLPAASIWIRRSSTTRTKHAIASLPAPAFASEVIRRCRSSICGDVPRCGPQIAIRPFARTSMSCARHWLSRWQAARDGDLPHSFGMSWPVRHRCLTGKRRTRRRRLRCNWLGLPLRRPGPLFKDLCHFHPIGAAGA